MSSSPGILEEIFIIFYVLEFIEILLTSTMLKKVFGNSLPPNLFHAAGLFLYPLRTLENLWFSVVLREYKKGTPDKETSKHWHEIGWNARLVLLALLALSWRWSLSYRNESTDLLCKPVDWFLYDMDLHHERVE